MLNSIRELLKSKRGQTLQWATPSDPVSVAVRRMAEGEIGALPVIENGRLVGIFSERDVLRRIVDQRLDPDKTPVAAVMTPNPKSVASTETVEEAMRLMNRGGFRHLPVVDGDAVVGMLSIRDTLQWLLDNQQQIIDNLIGAVRMAPPSHRRRG